MLQGIKIRKTNSINLIFLEIQKLTFLCKKYCGFWMQERVLLMEIKCLFFDVQHGHLV